MANRPYKQFYVATSGTLLQSGTTTDLAIGQLGVFDVKTWQANTAPNFPVVQSIVIAQGTPDLTLAEGEMQSDVTFKSDAIFGKNISGWKVKKAQTPKQRIISVGFDGLDITKTLSAKPGEVKTLYLTLTGQPISRFYSDDQKGLTVSLVVGTPCTSDCTDDCAGDTVTPESLADGLIAAFNNYQIYGHQSLKDYIKVEKLIQCTNPSGWVTTNYTKYDLTIIDNGENTDLGIVQAQYPGLVITRTARVGVLSTYELISNAGTPTTFSNSPISVVPNCTTCPSGYTLVPQYNVFSITRAGNIAAATIASAYTSVIVSGSTTKLSFTNGQSVFQVYSTSALSAVQAIAPTTDIVVAAGIAQNVCTLNGAGVTTAWTTIGVCPKATKNWIATFESPSCNPSGNILTDLQAYYAGIGTVTLLSTSSNFCVSTYNLATLSDNPYCADCDSPLYTWKQPQPYINGNPWVAAVTTDGSGTDCVAGVKFTSAFFMPERDECTFEGIPYYSDPLYITASIFDPEQAGSCAPSPQDWPLTVLQEIQFPAGYGNFISALEKLDKYYKNVFYNADPVVRKYRGYQWNTDFQGYYDEYILEYSVEKKGTFQTQVRYEYFEDHYFIPQSTGNAFENTINSFLSSGGIQVPLQHI